MGLKLFHSQSETDPELLKLGSTMLSDRDDLTSGCFRTSELNVDPSSFSEVNRSAAHDLGPLTSPSQRDGG